ncbi:MAG: DUF2683 family protein [Candidatus Woesearchaeota archaeon]|jgi:hypothetical protein|nr:DUF2683 family protein [Candidatus Woesearchaeota archaeon]MDP7181940.1 DUF2683 family protein [Candidatus Woesearchaeota archaeon]MDP7199255.1 DUF2683 family protein [Candidatus Woesearchaeota archaeon]MDP7467938.1 DUF2683 family protein [Candidatus Woesearchaeota archaeon]MDP7647858.1 DUF2683 family protein [Candidatus Woesearchaeota archaeon]|tara:strand:- start:452 stop:685 length:234 start_codon:yes stop_codon:yes gene_type:complete
MKALIDIPKDVNQTLHIVKIQNDLRNKAEAISLVVKAYEKDHMEPELRPDFVEKIRKGEKKKGIKFKNVDELRKRHS